MSSEDLMAFGGVLMVSGALIVMFAWLRSVPLT